MAGTANYPARLSIEYKEKFGRLSTFFRGIIAIPIAFISGGLSYGMAALNMYSMVAPFLILMCLIMASMAPIAGKGLWPAWYPLLMVLYIPLYLTLSPLVLMILFRKKYPKWWYDWAVNLTQFLFRVHAFMLLLTDRYPSTDDEQLVHVEIDYPDAEKELARGLPLVKWILVIPHYIALFFVGIALWITTLIAWFAILFTSHYPRALFNFASGYLRWCLRVWTYTVLLTTDKYPPFSLD